MHGHGWMSFLFGSPQKTIYTCVGFVILACVINPSLGELIVGRIINALISFIFLVFILGLLGKIVGFKIGGSGRH